MVSYKILNMVDREKSQMKDEINNEKQKKQKQIFFFSSMPFQA